jgi:hypothetical protein
LSSNRRVRNTLVEESALEPDVERNAANVGHSSRAVEEQLMNWPVVRLTVTTLGRDGTTQRERVDPFEGQVLNHILHDLGGNIAGSKLLKSRSGVARTERALKIYELHDNHWSAIIPRGWAARDWQRPLRAI